jgi:hypothetical protein
VVAGEIDSACGPSTGQGGQITGRAIVSPASGCRAFSFGDSKGVIRGALGALGVALRYVDPARWKADLNVPADKQLAKARAWTLFPGCVALLSSEAKAEAAMIALFGCLTLGTPPPGIRPAVKF